MLKSLALAASLVIALSSAPAAAQSDGGTLLAPGGLAASEWQSVIHNQIQAFRDLNPAVAFSYSAASFHETFKTPEDFFVTILNSGYAPVMDSQSESFGPYDQVAPDTVYQDVKFVAKDNQYYEAVYGLTHEVDGWRVETVVLAKTPGVGV